MLKIGDFSKLSRVSIRMLRHYDDKEKMEAFLLEKQTELKKLSEETQYKLMLLETAKKRLRKEQTMSYNVTVKTIPERYAATVRMIIPSYEDEQRAWSVLYSECGRSLVPADPCLAGADFFDEEYKEENVDVRTRMNW